MQSIMLNLMFRIVLLKSSWANLYKLCLPRERQNLCVMAIGLIAIISCSGQRIAEPLSNSAPTQVEVAVTDLSISSEKVLQSHNQIRSRLGIPPLRWSTRLESFAAQWANYLTDGGNCVPRKRGSIGLPQQKNGLGENLQRVDAVRFGDGRVEVASVDENQIVIDWARQGIDFNYTDNKCGVGKTCENYTQVVWRDSQVVGCAAASCADKSQIWVCNYDPPGNFLGQKPY